MRHDGRSASRDGENDHVYLLVECPPKVSVSALVNALKGTSSGPLRKEMKWGQVLLERRPVDAELFCCKRRRRACMNAGVSGAAYLDETEKSKWKIAAGCLRTTQVSPFATI
jgi:REP element-mobilizing transposase RayT